MRSPLRCSLPWGLAVALAACDESDLAAIRLRIAEDLSGTVTASGVRIPHEAGPIEAGTRGAVWTDRAEVVCAAGRFESLTALAIEDLAFAAGTTADGISYVQVTVPRGPETRWARLLSPLSTEERRKGATTLDPTGRLREIGSPLKVEITLPGAVVAHGVVPEVRRVQEEVEGNRATLLVSAEAAQTEGRALVWQITWRK